MRVCHVMAGFLSGDICIIGQLVHGNNEAHLPDVSYFTIGKLRRNKHHLPSMAVQTRRIALENEIKGVYNYVGR